MNVLERLVPPLFLCTKNNTLEEQDEADLDDQKGGERDTKRIKSDTCDTSGGDERQEDVYSILAASTNTTSLSTTSKQEYHTQLKNQLANHIAENEKLLQRRQNVYQSLVRLHELYETGLDGIARMNDLTFVPDNVMPEWKEYGWFFKFVTSQWVMHQ